MSTSESQELLRKSLLSTQKASSDLTVLLHPLALLTISDYVTRHTVRGLEGPVVGGLLGRHDGREITIEHAFDAHLIHDKTVAGEYLLHEDRFTERLEQSR